VDFPVRYVNNGPSKYPMKKGMRMFSWFYKLHKIFILYIVFMINSS
jgi:hypothetical protein